LLTVAVLVSEVFNTCLLCAGAGGAWWLDEQYPSTDAQDWLPLVRWCRDRDNMLFLGRLTFSLQVTGMDEQYLSSDAQAWLPLVRWCRDRDNMLFLGRLTFSLQVTGMDEQYLSSDAQDWLPLVSRFRYMYNMLFLGRLAFVLAWMSSTFQQTHRNGCHW
jgi:hypothetical protein